MVRESETRGGMNAQQFVEQQEKIVVVQPMLLPFRIRVNSIQRDELRSVCLEPGEIRGDDVGNRSQNVGGATKHGRNVLLFRKAGARRKASFACENVNQSSGVVFIHNAEFVVKPDRCAIDLEQSEAHCMEGSALDLER